MTKNNQPTYPLGEDAGTEVTAASGRKTKDITLEAIAKGELNGADLLIKPDTLLVQARFAREGSFTQLAENLERAAELTAVPNDELLRMYETLRPGRATHAEMIALAERLELQFHAPLNAALVREAAKVYLTRNLVKRPPPPAPMADDTF